MKKNSKIKSAVLGFHLLSVMSVLGALFSLRYLMYGGESLVAMAVSSALCFLFAVIGVSLFELAAYGLRNQKSWGLPYAVVLGVFNIFSLGFPIAVYVLWNLLPDETRETVTREAKTQFSSSESGEKGASAPPASEPASAKVT